MKMHRTVIRSLPLFEKMSDADLDRFMSHATLRRLVQGEAVFKQGQTAKSFYLLLSGRLKVTQVTGDGQQIIVRVVHPGELFGFARALARPDYPGTATAATDSMALGLLLIAAGAGLRALTLTKASAPVTLPPDVPGVQAAVSNGLTLRVQHAADGMVK